MNVYIIREAKTTKVQGIFWANNLEELSVAVDEMGDVTIFEWCKINQPGGMWHDLMLSETKASAQSSDDADDCFAIHPLIETSEFLLFQLMDQKGPWRRLRSRSFPEMLDASADQWGGWAMERVAE